MGLSLGQADTETKTAPPSSGQAVTDTSFHCDRLFRRVAYDAGLAGHGAVLRIEQKERPGVSQTLAPTDHRTAQERPWQPSEGRSRRVLIVDDDPALNEMLTLVLHREGFEPVWCRDGNHALGAFRDIRPHLVLLDVTLPGLDGLSICRISAPSPPCPP